MKISFFTLATLLAAFSPMMAQSTIKAPPSLALHWEQIPAQFRAPLIRMGIAPEATPELGPGDLRLLSTEVFIEYSFEPAPDSTAFSRTLFTYEDGVPAGGFTTTGVNAEYDGENWNVFSRTTTTTDALGRITAEISEGYDAETATYSPENRAETFFRGESLETIDSILVYTWDGADWVSIVSLYYRYDPATDQLLEATTIFDFGFQTINSTSYYFYDDEGQNIRTYTEADLGAGNMPVTELIYEYEAGLLRIATTYEFPDPSDTSLTAPTDRTVYLYQPDTDLLEEEESFVWDGAWVLVDRITYAYDEEERVIRQTIETPVEGGGGISEIDEQRYAYAQNEQFSRIDQYFGVSDEPLTLDSRIYYQYDLSSATLSPSATRLLGCWPNPATDQVFLGLPEVEAVSVFNTQGQALALPFNPADRSLNLSGAPAGLYFIAATTPDGATYVARVVKR